MHSKHKYLMGCGHLCADFNQGVLSSILPFLIAAHNFDYATAATLVMVSNIVGSIIQPVFGHLADKKEMPWSMALGLLLAGGGMAVTGLLDSFAGLCIAVMVSGIGVAFFHPVGALVTNRSADPDRQAASMSIFSFGGTIGFTLGPIAATAAITMWGLKGTVVLLLPVIAEVIMLIANNRGIAEVCRIKPGLAPEETPSDLEMQPVLSDNWGGFFKLCAVIFGRSIVFYSFNTFVALYWIEELGQTEVFGNGALTAFYALNALSTLAGGSLADRYGNKRIVLISCIAIAPFTFMVPLAGHPVLSMIMLAPVGLGLGFCHSPLVTSGQNLLPNHQGLASGVTLGLSVSIGGIFAPLLGSIGNSFGLDATFMATGIIGAATLLIALFIPGDNRNNIERKTQNENKN